MVQERLRSDLIEASPRLIEILPLEIAEDREFRELLARHKAAVSELDGTRRTMDLTVAIAVEPKIRAERAVVASRACVTQAEEEVAHSNAEGKTKINKGRTRTTLGNPNVSPPFLARVALFIAKPFLNRYLGGAPVLEHPIVSQAKTRLGQREADLVAQQIIAQIREAEIKGSFKPQLTTLESSVVRTRETALVFGEQIALGRKETTLQFIDLFPERRERVANLWARKVSVDPEQLRQLDVFMLQNIPDFANLNERQRKQRFGTWIVEGRTPTLEEYNSLPESIKAAWVRYQREQLFTEE